MNFRIASQITIKLKDSLGGVRQIVEELKKRYANSLSIAMENEKEGSQLLITGPSLSKAAEQLISQNLEYSEDEVIVIPMDEAKGKLTNITHSFLESNIELDYICPITRLDQSEQSLVFKVSNIPLASSVLSKAA